jgi:putative ABC transport system permease protein
MVWHWLATGWRSLIANPLFAFITIASLSIGCCGALLAGANINQHLSFERWVPDADRILLIRPHFRAGPAAAPGGARQLLGKAEDVFLIPMMSALEGKIPGIEAQSRFLGGEGPEEGDQSPIRFGMVDKDFYTMFGLQFVEGDARTAAADRNGIVLTESEARKRFGAGPWLGKIMKDDIPSPNPVAVVGVVRDLPTTSHIKANAFGSMDQVFGDIKGPPGMPDIRTSWNALFGGRHFIKVKEGVDIDTFISAAERQMTEIVAKAAASQPGPAAQMEFTLVPLLDLHFASQEVSGIKSSGEMTMLATLGTAALALLLVSGFNYVTLSLARSLKRRREVAVRKALGARQSNLISQYLVESIMVTAVSLVIGFALAQFLSPWFARALGQPVEMFNLADPVLLWAMALGGIVLAVAVGAYPAFYLAHVRPRAGLDTGATAALGPIGAIVSRGLLAVQIAAASVLLTIALTMGAQSNYIETRPLGFTMTDMHTVPSPCPIPQGALNNEQRAELRACDTRFLGFVRQAPGVEQASRASTFVLLQPESQPQPFSLPGVAGVAGRTLRVGVETDFLQMMGASLLAGRFYDSNSGYDRQFLDRKMLLGDHTSDRAPIIVTKAFLPLLKVDAPEDAIGKTITLPQGAARIGAFEIVGVVDDWHRQSLRKALDPIIFTPGGIQMQMVAKIDSTRLAETLAWLRKTWREQGGAANADNAYIGTVPFRESFENSYRDDQRLMIAVASFAALSIAVAGVGVYGLTAFDMRRRVREIGIRKALGAEPAGVAGMIISRQVAFATIASALSWPIGFWLANEWLSGFVYRTPLGFAVAPLASLFIIGFVAIAVSLTAIPAVAIRPSLALRLGT